MKLAIVGAGIAGLCCAFLLHDRHDITLFEAGPHLGGHANTVLVRHESREIHVDTGFIVFNRRNYPGFCRLLQRLDIHPQPAPMSFSVRCDRTGLEYGGGSLRALFAQPTNLLRPSFWSLLAGIRAIARDGKALLADLPPDATIADLCATGRIARPALDLYLLPMAAAIWSAPREALDHFPARFLLRFFDQHGMLDLRERPQWLTIPGGSQQYVARLVARFAARCRTACPVEWIRRGHGGITLRSPSREERFDQVILACHSDQALALLADATPAEREILSAMPYQPNDAVLHTDARLLPRARAAWSGWNYLIRHDPDRRAPVSVTYNLTILQSLGTREPLCVTLNDADAIDPARILARFAYHHPLYTVPGELARTRHAQISGAHARTHFCGAYWRNGFHEDGVQSALDVCRAFGVSL